MRTEIIAMTVWELRNETLKELYIGPSDLSAEELKSRHQGQRPPLIAHWDPANQKIEYVELAPALTPNDAFDFIYHYVRKVAREGWKLLHDAKTPLA